MHKELHDYFMVNGFAKEWDVAAQTHLIPLHCHKRRRTLRNQAVLNWELHFSSEDSDANKTKEVPIPELPQSAPPPETPAFSCPICLGPLSEETSTKCGHIFCKMCIEASIKVQHKCPTCRKRLRMKDTIRVYLPTNICFGLVDSRQQCLLNHNNKRELWCKVITLSFGNFDFDRSTFHIPVEFKDLPHKREWSQYYQWGVSSGPGFRFHSACVRVSFHTHTQDARGSNLRLFVHKQWQIQECCRKWVGNVAEAEAEVMEFERLKVERRISASIYAMNGGNEYVDNEYDGSDALWDLPTLSQ
ncbi:RING/U-box superfamily protein [Prunus dulcis]|uniref:RING/U-box superfamily protein n=1 Tax=Prunus dulcis TaxID=3755 RepID=A0A5H2XPH6_PRUDU|nr:RING/U-box superfamily protein [Prunus dulcis]